METNKISDETREKLQAQATAAAYKFFFADDKDKVEQALHRADAMTIAGDVVNVKYPFNKLYVGDVVFALTEFAKATYFNMLCAIKYYETRKCDGES